MENIHEINSANEMYSLMDQPVNHVQIQEEKNKQSQPIAYDVHITQLGELSSVVEKSDKLVASELKEFHESIFNALQNGHVDAKKLSENASDKIKTIAKETGINLQLAVAEFSEQAQQMNIQVHSK